jgi:hypothetical protein
MPHLKPKKGKEHFHLHFKRYKGPLITIHLCTSKAFFKKISVYCTKEFYPDISHMVVLYINHINHPPIALPFLHPSPPIFQQLSVGFLMLFSYTYTMYFHIICLPVVVGLFWGKGQRGEEEKGIERKTIKPFT